MDDFDLRRRDIDGRWQIALELVDNGRSATNEDDWIQQAVSYLTQIRRCKTDQDKRRVRKEMPNIAFAVELHEHRDRMVRAVPEARLLAGLSIEQAAAACKMPVEGLAAYEALFYRVIGRDQHFAIIATQAFGKHIHNGSMTLDDRDVLMKLLAFRGGPHFLEKSLDYCLNGLQFPANVNQATPAELERLYFGLCTHALLHAKVLSWPDCQIESERFKKLADEVNEMLADRAKAEATDKVDRSARIAEICDIACNVRKPKKKLARRPAAAVA